MEFPSSIPLKRIKLQEHVSSPQIPDNEKLSNENQVAKSTTWTQKQLYLVASFFFYHSDKLLSDSSRKRWKVFKIMSRLLQSRNVNQCRSYTKKLFNTFKTVANINSFFKGSLPKYKSTVGQLKSANSKLYDIPLSSEQESENQKEEQEKQYKISNQKTLITQSKVQKQENGIKEQIHQSSKAALPQVQTKLCFNNNLWFLSHQEFVIWLNNMHYLNCFMQFQ